jgi:hypothetical protein
MNYFPWMFPLCCVGWTLGDVGGEKRQKDDRAVAKQLPRLAFMISRPMSTTAGTHQVCDCWRVADAPFLLENRYYWRPEENFRVSDYLWYVTATDTTTHRAA